MPDVTFGQIVDDIVQSDRQRDYGPPLLNFTRIAIMWTTQLRLWGVIGQNAIVSPQHVAWMMIDMKQAREMQTPKDDNLIDTAGYAACLDNMVRYYGKVYLNSPGYMRLPASFDGLATTELSILFSVLEAIKLLEQEKSFNATTGDCPF